MYRWRGTYVPDELWAKLGSEIDHFEYHDKEYYAVAVYTDGRREEFSTRVTEEIYAEETRKEEERWARVPGRVVLYKGIITLPTPKNCGQLTRIIG